MEKVFMAMLIGSAGTTSISPVLSGVKWMPGFTEWAIVFSYDQKPGYAILNLDRLEGFPFFVDDKWEKTIYYWSTELIGFDSLPPRLLGFRFGGTYISFRTDEKGAMKLVSKKLFHYPLGDPFDYRVAIYIVVRSPRREQPSQPGITWEGIVPETPMISWKSW